MKAKKLRDKYFKENPEIDIAFYIAKILKNARLEAKLSQKQLAIKMKSTQPSIARAESGNLISGNEFIKRYLRNCKPLSSKKM